MESNNLIKRVAVVGSRTYNNYALVEKTIDAILEKRGWKDVIIVSGGARGVDTLAELYAIRRNHPMKVYPADWSIGEQAGYLRNKTIVENSDFVIAFHLGNSKGTQHTIDIAKNMGVEVIEISIQP